MHYYFGVLKKYAVFSGRATRKEYWMFVLINTLIGIFFIIIINFLQLKTIGIIIKQLYSIAIFIPGLAVTVRRLHDTNHSGWWLLLEFIPIVVMLIITIFQITIEWLLLLDLLVLIVGALTLL